MSRRALSVLAPASLLLATLALGGCVSVFPQAKPVQLYELSPEMGQGSAPPPTKVVNVRLASVDFEEAAAGDRLLTVKDGQAAYVAGARWVSPARTLFDEDLERAFAAHAGPARLVVRSDVSNTPLSLSVGVETFRVAFEGATPSVQIVLHARLIRYPDRVIVLDRRIAVERKADANHVTAIVKAYNAALGAALTSLVEATDQAAAAA
jgi:cholesterol transport system auxiliary component